MSDPERPDKPVIRSKQLVREPGFFGHRAGEQRWFTLERKRNRIKNKLARRARKKGR